MGLWLINVDTMAGSRFVVSAAAEATACLIALERTTAAHPGEQAWLDTHLPEYREYLAEHPIAALVVRAALRTHWLADFVTPTPPVVGEPTFEQVLEQIRATAPEAVREHLAVSLGHPIPAALHRADLAEHYADLLEWLWTRAVLPHWPQRRRVIEADIVARTRQLSLGGWAAALDDMRPGMRWLGDGRLQVNNRDYPPREISGGQLLFVPVTVRGGWVSWTEPEPDRYAIIYPCSGPLAEPGRAPVPEALGRLLGPARARILVLLQAPKSTTQLVALSGQGLGSVGGHLKVLLDARLVLRRRAGRSVLYCRTAAGNALVQAATRQ